MSATSTVLDQKPQSTAVSPQRTVDGISLKGSEKKARVDVDILGVLSRRKWLLLFPVPFAVLIGALYQLFTPPTYQSQSRVLLMRSDAAAMASQNGSANELISQDLLATHTSLIQSPMIVAEALREIVRRQQELNSRKDSASPEELSELQLLSNTLTSLLSLKTWPEAAPSPENLQPDDYESIAASVIQNLYVTRGGAGNTKNSHTLTIAFKHTHPDATKVVVEKIIYQYQQFIVTKFKDINKEAVSLISNARTELEAEISQFAADYQEFRRNAPLISRVGSGINVHEQRFQQLAAELGTVAIQIDETKGRLELVNQGIQQFDNNDQPSIELLTLIDEKSATRLGVLASVESREAQSAAFLAQAPLRAAGAQVEFSSLLELRSKFKQVSRDFGPNHPEVRDLALRISEMENFLADRQAELSISNSESRLTAHDVIKAYVRMLESDLSAMNQRKLNLERQQAEAEVESKRLIDFELQDRELNTKMRRHEALYDSVVTRLRDINMKQDATALIQEQIENPTKGKKVAPTPIVAGAIALITSLLISGISIFAAESLDRRIHSIDELEQTLKVPVIAEIPDFRKNGNIRKVIDKIKSTNPTIAAEVLAYHAPKESVSEAIRTMRTHLNFCLNGNSPILAITSASQGDGKTTIASNLAVSIASSGRRTIIIDCDMRRPNVHHEFGNRLELGLAEYLREEAKLSQILQSTAAGNLHMISAGIGCDNPAELLQKSLFKQLLDDLRQDFDQIILDCPPLLPVTDPAIIAPLVDGILLVACLDEQTTHNMSHCRRILMSIRSNPIGVVVNRATKQNSRYYYNYSKYEG